MVFVMTNKQTTKANNPFRLPLKKRWLAALLERILGLSKLAEHYDCCPDFMAEPETASKKFLRYTMKVLNFKLDVKDADAFAAIPKSGPVVFVANHPLGGLEGVAMSELLLNVRPDLKVLTNELLTRIPEFQDLFIGVDVLSKNAAAKNAKGIRAVCKHLGQGGAILIYPAGVVSALNTKKWQIEDFDWDPLVGRLCRKYKAHCVPFFVEGRNSRLFYLAGLIHKRLRTAMLARELSNKEGKIFGLRVGEVISPVDIRELNDDVAVTHCLRMATNILGAKLAFAEKPVQSNASDIHPDDGVDEQIQKDVAALDEYKLLTKNEFSVYCAPFDKLNSIMKEIAREREVTFRAAGEGTGKSLDSDEYDHYYMHLFVWDEKHSRIVGGYRMAHADKIVKERGIHALYSRLLYNYDESYIERIGGALEMGRSFVTTAYQRHPKALDLLWRGIGAYVVKNPDYHTLFGCVSISNEHSALAQAFLSESMLESFRAEQEYLVDVSPLAPLKVKGRVWTREILASLGKIAVINKLLGQCDPGKSIPVLLRQYLALNGRFVCFSINRGFNDSLDGLILVDLRKTPQKYLLRYLGKDGLPIFAERWKLNQEEAA